MTKGPLRLQAETYTQNNHNSKLGILKIGPVQLELEPSDYNLINEWYHSETMDPKRFRRFRRLVVRAHRDWYSVVHIDNKVVKRKATSIDAGGTTLSQSWVAFSCRPVRGSISVYRGHRTRMSCSIQYMLYFLIFSRCV